VQLLRDDDSLLRQVFFNVLRHHHPNTANKVDVIYALSQVRCGSTAMQSELQQQQQRWLLQQSPKQKQQQWLTTRTCTSPGALAKKDMRQQWQQGMKPCTLSG
jgi:hypothetical protein